ncbi:MAG: hypothetical protein FWC23_05505 [Chitinispirillia bacterium]|nr:hypothetical protein [Chitinispirillia bacterium]MCL2268624.1 hypothetical protein [Chitinispirillia bacterium]
MNGINANIPVMNMPQVTSQQSEVVRAPMAHQQQNADTVRDNFDHQMRIARGAEEAEGKNINPEDKREQERKGKKRLPDDENGGDEENDDMPPEVMVQMTDNGRLVDLEA